LLDSLLQEILDRRFQDSKMAADLVLSSLKQSLSADFGIPTDIKFVFTKKGETDGSTIIEEIRAHKNILALASDVLKKGFYGGMEDNGSINIEDANKEAFEVMIHFIYNKEIDLNHLDFDMLCSVYYLADKYNITPLEKETLKAIKSKEIPTENVLDIGLLAIKHSVHDKLAEALFEAAAQRLSRIFKGDLTRAVDYLTKIDADVNLDSARYKSVVKIMARLRSKELQDTSEDSEYQKGSVTSRDAKRNGGFPETLVRGEKIRRFSPRGNCPMCAEEFDMTLLERHAYMCEG